MIRRSKCVERRRGKGTRRGREGKRRAKELYIWAKEPISLENISMFLEKELKISGKEP